MVQLRSTGTLAEATEAFAGITAHGGMKVLTTTYFQHDIHHNLVKVCLKREIFCKGALTFKARDKRWNRNSKQWQRPSQ